MSVAYLAVMATMELLHSSLEMTHEAIVQLKVERGPPPSPHVCNLPTAIFWSGSINILLFYVAGYLVTTCMHLHQK